MICIKMAGGHKWHYLRSGRALCNVRGRETDRRDLGLAGNEDVICSSCDSKLRWLGRATRLARKQMAAGTAYRPVHREHFEISVTHLTRMTLARADQTD
jgi:hypothetical protein